MLPLQFLLRNIFHADELWTNSAKSVNRKTHGTWSKGSVIFVRFQPNLENDDEF
jgi:hypothetical protein